MEQASDNPSSHFLLSQATRLLVGKILPHIDHAVDASRRPFRQQDMLLPNLTSRRYGWVHYGAFFPKLPSPHRYSHVMTLLGTTGTRLFDNDYLVKTTPRDTATLLSSTAANNAYCYHSYSMKNACDIRRDGSAIALGDNLVISGEYPHFRVQVGYDDIRMEMEINCTDTVSWFVKNPAYDHFSLLASCTGSITQAGVTTPIDKTLCTFEYARCVSPHTLIKKPLPIAWKLPADFFTYQIINLDDNTQLLLTDVRSQGITAFKGVHIRSLDGRAEVYVDDVEMQVLTSTQAVDPKGRTMRLPERFSWRVKEAGGTLLEIECRIASDWRFGHGRGYVACYDFNGQIEGQPRQGQGYIEYVDCESREETPHDNS